MPKVQSGRSETITDEIERARAQEYALLAVLLAGAPNGDLLTRIAGLTGEGSPLGQAHAALGQAAAAAECERVEREFFDLFVGVGRGELMPYGSYYVTGTLHAAPLARLRADLATLGMSRAERCSEPEDHAALLCEIMAGLVDRRFDTPVGADRSVFEKHLAPWIGRFFGDLQTAKNANFYRRVGAVGQRFVEIESEAFRLADRETGIWLEQRNAERDEQPADIGATT
jgi:TorA maturation chaperone TorD